MTPYSFCVLRYIHDGVTNEFVNVGVAVFSADVPYLKAKCTIQYGRITRVFDRIDGERFKQNVRYIEDEIDRLGHELRQRVLLPSAELGTTVEALLKRVLPPDDSAIQFAPAGYGVTADLDATLAELYDRYVERYAGQPEIPSRSDDEVWRVFREALERRSVLSSLTPKAIIAPDYEYQFRAGWKNEIWHVYEPVSFDLVEPNSLVDKANRWWGRSASLAESPERFQLHLLIGAPQNARLDQAFGKARNILRKMVGSPELIMESDADRFAGDLEREINVHRDDGVRDLFDSR
jgi:hypothetical protein